MASITFTVPDAALPIINEVCIADGWDGVTPLNQHIKKMFVGIFKERAATLKVGQQGRAIQDMRDAANAETDAAFGI